MKSAPRIYDYTLSPNGSQWLPVVGSYFRINGTTGQVVIKLDTGAEIGPLSDGQGMKNTPFNGLMILDKSGAANTGQIIIADDDFVDQRFSGTVTIAGGTSFAQAAVTVGTVAVGYFGARPTRRYFLVQNKDPIATLWVSLGGVTATQANGIKVPPGTSFEMNGNAPTNFISIIADISNPNVILVEGF